MAEQPVPSRLMNDNNRAEVQEFLNEIAAEIQASGGLDNVPPAVRKMFRVASLMYAHIVALESGATLANREIRQ